MVMMVSRMGGVLLLLALGGSLAYVPLPLFHPSKAVNRASCQISTRMLHRLKVLALICFQKI
jgi:hypothetical protein